MALSVSSVLLRGRRIRANGLNGLDDDLRQRLHRCQGQRQALVQPTFSAHFLGGRRPPAPQATEY
jgi:hypothetical protein